MAKLMSKSGLIEKIVEQHPNNMTRKDVKAVIESLAKIGYQELKKKGAFFVPGFAKFVVIKACHKGAERHQSVHEGANNIQGEAGSEDHQGSPGKGYERRRIVASETSIEFDGQRGALGHAPTPE
jgi:nucleoid DNA-binding protein